MEIISSEDSKSSNKLEGGVVDKLRDDFEKLLTSEKSVDVEIHIKEDGRSIFAHSLILEGKIFHIKRILGFIQLFSNIFSTQ